MVFRDWFLRLFGRIGFLFFFFSLFVCFVSFRLARMDCEIFGNLFHLFLSSFFCFLLVNSPHSYHLLLLAHHLDVDSSSQFIMYIYIFLSFSLSLSLSVSLCRLLTRISFFLFHVCF